MPILFAPKKIVFFPHIPKAAGTSLIKFIEKLGIEIGFHIETFRSENEHAWMLTSPQHILGREMAKLIPNSVFSDSFAIVRNPISRFESAFNFQKSVEKTIESNITIDEFIHQLVDNEVNHASFDNHFRLQSDFLLPGFDTTVFKLESDLDEAYKHIKTLFQKVDSDAEFPHENVLVKRIINPERVIDDESIAKLTKFYRPDFELFEY